MAIIKRISTEINLTVSDEPLNLSASLQESINLYWDSLMESGKTYQRGEIFSIKEVVETGEALHILLYKTDYAHFLFSRHCEIPSNVKCRVVVANGVIRTQDNFLILGQMNRQTAQPGRLQFIAGGIDVVEDVREDSVDILATLIREAKEEVGIDLTDRNLVLKVEPKYIVQRENIGVVFMVQLAIDSLEFQKRYEQYENNLIKMGIEPEFSSIELLSADHASVANFLKLDERPKAEYVIAVLETEFDKGRLIG
jgi:8-oxo-dGTP pyrophosphatase MutT (NUDIX family)